MDEKPEVIRHRIDETRSALTEKLETLEREVRGTVRDARDAVACTVENVRDTVNSTVSNVRETVTSTVDNVRDKMEDTMYSVKEALNVQHQVQAHPWAMLGGSVAAGYVLGALLPQSGARHDRPAAASGGRTVYSQYAEETASARSVGRDTAMEAVPKTRGFLSGIGEQLAPEIQKVKGMAIGAAMGLVRDLVKQQLPEQLRSNVDELVNSVTTKLGGEPVRGPLFAGSTQRSASPNDRSSCRESSFARAGAGREDAGEPRFDM